MRVIHWECALTSELTETGKPAFYVRQCSEFYELSWQLRDECVTYQESLSENWYEFEQFLMDLYAACKAIGDGSISLGFDAVYKTDDVLRWLNSAIILNYGVLRLEIWNKPKSFDKRPVALSISYYGSENVTVRTNSQKLLQFSESLLTALEEIPSLTDLLQKDTE